MSKTQTEPFVFGVDLDGVCANYTLAFRDFCAKSLGRDPETMPMQRSWGFQEWGLDNETYEQLHKAAVTEERILASLDTIEGAAESLWRLSDAGVWIRIVTHRLYVNWGHEAAAGDTVAWLDKAKIPYRDLCFVGKKRDIGADAYIDDGPHNIEALRAAGRTAIIFDQPYNSHLDGLRAMNWNEAEEIVYDLMVDAGSYAPLSFPGFDPDPERLTRRKNS